MLEGCPGLPPAGGDFHNRGGVAEESPILVDGLVLVSGRVGADEWDCSNVLQRLCGSLYLPVWNRVGSGGDMGVGRLEHGLETPAGGPRQSDGCRDWHADGLRLDTNWILENQRNFMDSRHCLRPRQLCCPLQSRRRSGEKRQGGRRNLPSSARAATPSPGRQIPQQPWRGSTTTRQSEPSHRPIPNGVEYKPAPRARPL